MDTKSGVCDWKTYGLFRAPNAYQYIIRKDFHILMRTGEIYPPLELEKTE